MTILGISVGAIRTGISILKNGELLEWETHTYSGKWSDEKLTKIINRYRWYIQLYGVTALAVKIPPQSHHSIGIVQIIASLRDLCDAGDLPYALYAISDLRRLTNLNHSNSMIEYVLLEHPVLKDEHMTLSPHRSYMLEAVLVAQVYSTQHST